MLPPAVGDCRIPFVANSINIFIIFANYRCITLPVELFKAQHANATTTACAEYND